MKFGAQANNTTLSDRSVRALKALAGLTQYFALFTIPSPSSLCLLPFSEA